MKFKAIYYVNQFFGQIGGEDKAGMEPMFKEGAIGPAMGFNTLIKEEGEVVGTIICGDNYFNENKEEAMKFIMDIVKDKKPDLLIAGPAFNAGRYGMACAGVSRGINEQLGIPVITGMYIENPGLDAINGTAYVISVSDSAAGMRKALPKMAKLAIKLGTGQKIGKPEAEGYIPQGKRLTVFSDERGSKRAVAMLVKRLKDKEFQTELPMPVFDRVDPAAAIKDLSKATIALVTTGGIVPIGNPDRVQSASAQKWAKYNISEIDGLVGNEYCTIHGGYDPVYANDFPDRVAPLDLLKKSQQNGVIGKVYEYFYTTTGTGTSVGNSITFGREIGQELKDAGVDGVIVTST